MADSVNNLFNSHTLDLIREMLFRRTGLRLDNDFATYTLSADASEVTIGTRDRAADGRRSPYIGSITLPLQPVEIDGQVAKPLIWSDNYPNTVNAFADYLLKNYGYLMEDGEFYGVGDVSQTPLVRGGVMTAKVDPTQGTFRVEATNQAARWRQGTQLLFKLATSNSLPGQDQFQLTGNPPDGQAGQPYDFTFTVVNGNPPYRFRVQQGTPPVVPDANTGRMYTAALDAAVGQYDWIMEVTDAKGRQATRRCSVQVTSSIMTFNPPAQNLEVLVGVPVTVLMGISGGRPPYQMNVISGQLPPTTALNSAALTGIFDGTYTTGQTSRQQVLTIQATDQDGQSLSRIFTFAIMHRNDATVVQSLKAKLVNWYATPVSDLGAGFTWTDAAGHGDLTQVGTLTKVTGPHATDFAVQFGQGHATANSAQHNFTQAFTLMTWAKTPADPTAQAQALFSKESVGKGWALQRKDSQVQVLTANAAGSQHTDFSAGTLTDGLWHLLFAKITPTPDSLYYASLSMEGNSPLDGSTLAGPMVPNPTLSLSLGYSAATGFTFTGALCDPVIFNDTLWADELRWMANGGAGRRYWELVSVPALSISGSSPVGQVGSSADFTYTITGGVPPYQATISKGALPSGRKMDASGHITGTFLDGGSFSWTVKVTDAAGTVVTLDDTQTVQYRTLRLQGTLIPGAVGTPYSSALTIVGGNTVYRNARVTQGVLPAPLALSIVDNTLVVSGTPAAAITASLVLAVDSTDGQTATSAQVLTIADTTPHPVVYIDLPLTGTDGSTTFTDRAGHPVVVDTGSPVIRTNVDPGGAMALDGASNLAITATQDMPVSTAFDWQMEIYPTSNIGFLVSMPYDSYPAYIMGYSSPSSNPGDNAGTAPYYGFRYGPSATFSGSWATARGGAAAGQIVMNAWNRMRGVHSAGNRVLVFKDDALVGVQYLQTTAADYPQGVTGNPIRLGRRWDGVGSSTYVSGQMRLVRLTGGRPQLTAEIADSDPTHYWAGDRMDWTDYGRQPTVSPITIISGMQLVDSVCAELGATDNLGTAYAVATVNEPSGPTWAAGAAIRTGTGFGNGGVVLADASAGSLERVVFIGSDGRLGFVVHGVPTVLYTAVLMNSTEYLVHARLTPVDGGRVLMELFLNGQIAASQTVSGTPSTYTVVTYYLMGAPASALPGLSGVTTLPLVAGKFAIYPTLTTDRMAAQARAWRRYNPKLSMSGTLPQGQVSVPYAAGLTLSGGDGTYSDARLLSGQLAPGLSMVINAGTLVISGTPGAYINSQLVIAVDSGDGQTVKYTVSQQIAPIDAVPIRQSLRAKVTSFWGFQGNAHDAARAKLTFTREDNQPIGYVTTETGKQALQAQYTAALYTTGSLGVNAIHGTDRWTFGGRFKPVQLGAFFISVANKSIGLGNELMAIGCDANGHWVAVVRDINRNDITLTGPSGAQNNRQHVSVSCDGTTLTMVIDGQIVASRAMPAVALKFDGNMRFAVQNSDPTYHSSAEVSELFYAHDALTQVELSWLANLGQGRTYADFGFEPYPETTWRQAALKTNPFWMYPLNESGGQFASEVINNGTGTYLNITFNGYSMPVTLASGQGTNANTFNSSGVQLPVYQNGGGSFSFLCYYLPSAWPQFARLLHLGNGASDNTAALTVNTTTVPGQLMAEVFDDSAVSLGNAFMPDASVISNTWTQVVVQYQPDIGRLAVVVEGLTSGGRVGVGRWPAHAMNNSFLMRSGKGEYAAGSQVYATMYNSLLGLADNCKLRDMAYLLPVFNSAIATRILDKTVAWWDYSETAGTVVDYHVNNIQPALTGVTYGQAPLSRYLNPSVSFANSGNMSVTHPLLSLNNEVAAMLWMSPGAESANFPKYLWKGAGNDANGYANYMFQYNQQDGTQQMTFRVSTPTQPYNDARTTNKLVQGMPYQFIGQRNAGNVELYTNGASPIRTAINQPTDALVADSSALTVGLRQASSQDNLAGSMFPAAVMRRSLLAEEIAFLLNSNLGRTYAQLQSGVPADLYQKTLFLQGAYVYYPTTDVGTLGGLVDDAGNRLDGSTIDQLPAYQLPSLRADRVGNAIGFAGRQSVMTNGQQVSQQDAGWLSMLILNTDTASAGVNRCVWNEGIAAGPTAYLIAKVTNGRQSFSFGNLNSSQQWDELITPGTFDATKPHHVILTWDTTGKSVYVDGKLAASNSVAGRATYGANRGYLGRDVRNFGDQSDGAVQPYLGQIQGFTKGRGRLTDAQAYAQASAGAIMDPFSAAIAALSPVGWWSFSETSGTQVADRSGKGHPGLLQVDASTLTTRGSYPLGDQRAMNFTPVGGSLRMQVGDGKTPVAVLDGSSATGSWSAVIYGRVRQYTSSFSATPILLGENQDGAPAVEALPGPDISHYYVRVSAVNSGSSVTGTLPIRYGEPVIIHLSQSGGLFTLWVNGIWQGQATMNFTLGTNARWTLGGGQYFNSGTINSFGGDLDEVAVFGQPLADADVAKLTALVRPLAGMVSFWPLQGTATDAYALNDFPAVDASNYVFDPQFGQAIYPKAAMEADIRDAKLVANQTAVCLWGWMWRDPATSSANQVLFQTGQGTTSGETFWIALNSDGTLSARVRDDNGTLVQQLNTPALFDRSKMHFVFAQLKSSGIDLWVDDTKVATRSFVLQSIRAMDRVEMGSQYSGYPMIAKMAMAGLSLGQEMSDAQVRWLYNNGNGRTYAQLFDPADPATDSYAQAVMAQNPLAWWRFNTPITDGAIVKDTAGKSPSMQLTVPAADAALQPGPSLVAGTASSYAKSGTNGAGAGTMGSLAVTGSYTAKAWVKTTDVGDLREIFAIDDEHSNRLFQMRLAKGIPQFTSIRGSIIGTAGKVSIADGVLHLLVGRVDTTVTPNTVSLYVDNVLVDSGTGIVNGTVNNWAYVGCYNGTGFHPDYQYSGAVGDVGLFNTPLTAGAMTALWETGRGVRSYSRSFEINPRPGEYRIESSNPVMAWSASNKALSMSGGTRSNFVSWNAWGAFTGRIRFRTSVAYLSETASPPRQHFGMYLAGDDKADGTHRGYRVYHLDTSWNVSYWEGTGTDNNRWNETFVGRFDTGSNPAPTGTYVMQVDLDGLGNMTLTVNGTVYSTVALPQGGPTALRPGWFTYGDAGTSINVLAVGVAGTPAT